MWEEMIHSLNMRDKLLEKGLEEKCCRFRAARNRMSKETLGELERLELSRKELQTIIDYNNSMIHTHGKPFLYV